MGINYLQFRDEIIIPTTKCMARIIDPAMHSDNVVNQILGTFCVESGLTYLKQFNNGPARGFNQMEEATFNDHVAYCERKGEDFKNKVIFCIYEHMYYEMPRFSEMCWNLRMQVVFTRLHYWRVKDPIPAATPLQGKYWKEHYNTSEGKGTVQKYIMAFPDLT